MAVLLENPYMDAVNWWLRSVDRLDLQPGMRVLDAGCGPGRLTIPAARIVGPAGEVVALDIQPGMLRKLERRVAASGLTNIRTVLRGIGEGKLERDAFDRVLLITVLGEIPDQEAAMREIYAALKPGGILCVQEIFPDPHYQSRAAVRRISESAGFRPIQQFGNRLAFAMNFVKPDSVADEQDVVTNRSGTA